MKVCFKDLVSSYPAVAMYTDAAACFFEEQEVRTTTTHGTHQLY